MACYAGGKAHRGGADRLDGVVGSQTNPSRGSKPSAPARLRLLLIALAAAFAVASQAAWGVARPVLGANVDLSVLAPAQRTAILDRLAAAGVTSVRMELDWNRVEPKPGAFTWVQFDAAVAAARVRRMDIVFVLGPCATWAVNPAWQVPADQKHSSVPKSPQLWRRYVKAAAKRFKGQVKCWQIREQPNARNFRGARSEYLNLLDLAAREIRSLDPGTRVIAPESGFLDIASVERFLTSAHASSADILGVYLPADAGRATLPWAVLANEVMDGEGGSRRKPVWVLGAQDGAAPESYVTGYLLAWAFGAERCYLPADAIAADWTKPFLDLTYTGFANPAPGGWMLFFTGPSGPVAAAWSSAEVVCLPPAAPSVSADDTATAGSGGEAQPPGDLGPTAPAPPSLALGPRPSLLAADQWLPTMRPGAPTRADVLAARGCADLSALPMVYADFSMPDHPEFGLANRALRALGGGACVEEQRQGRSCVHTCMTYREEEIEQDNPWLYFDVDDSWLYFDRGKSKIVVTVECEGSYMGVEKLGFNIVYDSTTGYRFTPWQWVGPGYGWRSYRVELRNVSFANRDGWDFRVNAKGSIQDLWVSAVTVEKAPEAGAPSVAGNAGLSAPVPAAATEPPPQTVQPQLASP